MSDLRVVRFWYKAKVRPAVIKRSDRIVSLDKASNTDRQTQRAIEASKEWFAGSKKGMALLLIENGKIVFEGYKGRGAADKRFYSQSIGKSLTSLAFGKAFCAGYFKSLDQKAVDFVPEFSNSNLGRSTLRQLLTMSSGLYWTKSHGWPGYINDGISHKNPKSGKIVTYAAVLVRNGLLTVDEILWGRGIKNINKDVAAPGKYFTYKAYDPIAIGKIIERVTGSFSAYFEKEVWKKIGAESAGLWTKDTNGSILTNAGFAARLRDWGRLAVWVLENREKNDCFGSYLKESTTKQISNEQLFNVDTNYSGPNWNGYGYYWWTNYETGMPGFCGKGFAGQYFCLNPEKRKILIKFSSKDERGIEKIFEEWNE